MLRARQILLPSLLVATLTLGACGGMPASRPDVSPRVWAQLGPEGEVSVRAIVAAGEKCPLVEVDRDSRRMQLRAAAGGQLHPATVAVNLHQGAFFTGSDNGPH